ncbi:MAG: outer membrane lipoprotein LolB [Ramlibacter sp.]
MLARRTAGAWLVASLLIAGCAHPIRTGAAFDPKTGPWSGRLALQVQDNQSQSFSTSFELKGQASAGELTLFTPLGSTAAVLTWSPGSAALQANGQTRQAASVDALVAQATGSAIPVAALFDWLAGTNTPVAGWQADLSGLGEGRLSAQRRAPPPLADLRLVLDR